ncbi:MAG: alanine--tRNA ligase, partial [Candidatus Omnitrophota bacterium]
NFSFGDYFKPQAIAWAWEFLVDALGIAADRLWASVYKDDSRAYDIWRNNIKLPPQRIIKLGDKDNFWPADAVNQGPDGPCGPCSEIFYDQGPGVGCGRPGCSPACDCPRFIEIWNLVFTQFDRQGKALRPLPQKNIDTGMGLERMAAVLQGKGSNFDIDIFVPIISEIRRCLEGQETKQEVVNLIADHIRAVVFAICDGVAPSNERRGYVVRKLIRRVFIKGRGAAGDKPFMYKLAPAVCRAMQGAYPELSAQRENIAAVIKFEEERCIVTLAEGERIIAGRKSLGPKEAFALYDTYGYSPELLEEKGVFFDKPALQAMMSRQRDLSRKSSGLSGDVFDLARSPYGEFVTEFSGYEQDSLQAKVLFCGKEKGRDAIILERTPFYAEAGGQVGDTGVISGKFGQAIVCDTQKAGRAIVHYIKEGACPRAGDVVTAAVDMSRRRDIARNHTATHLLQSALREILGGHIRQQGSLVCAEYLRFDFSHFKALGRDELSRVEELVNDYALAGMPIAKQRMSLDKARQLGALAFFGDKYADLVRVVTIGECSRELCGGIHLDNASGVGLFKIISQSAVASGVRRIEAVSGRFAYRRIKEDGEVLEYLRHSLAAPRERIRAEIEARLARGRDMEKKIGELELKLFRKDIPVLLRGGRDANGAQIVVCSVEFSDVGHIRMAADMVMQEMSLPGAVFLFNLSCGRGLFVLRISSQLIAGGCDAKKIIAELGLKGGGRPDLAQGGVKDKAWPGEEKIRQVVARMLSGE